VTRAERARLRAEARRYRQTAGHLYRQLDALRDARERGEDDPEDRETAGVWAMQAAHAERCADRLELHLMCGD
jgi:hypothetical protein